VDLLGAGTIDWTGEGSSGTEEEVYREKDVEGELIAGSLTGQEETGTEQSYKDEGDVVCGETEKAGVSSRGGVKGIKDGKTELVMQSFTERLKVFGPCLKGNTVSLKTTSRA